MSKKTDSTKKQILASTLNLLSSPKLNKINMNDIAIDSGISRQTLYKYFPTRIDLFVYLLKSKDRDHTFLEKLMIDQNLSLKEKLKLFIDYWGHNSQATHRVFSEIRLLKGADPKVELILAERRVFFKQKCERMIQILDDAGSLKSNFTFNESVDILCNLLSEDTWAYFDKYCFWSIGKYIDKTYDIIVNLLIGTSAKSAWSIRGY